MDLESRKLLEDIRRGFENHNDTIVQTIQTTVNGKIDRLTSNFNQWKENETREREEVKRKLDEYVIETEKYRKSTEPMVNFFNDTSAFRRVSKWLLGGFVAVGAGYLMFKEIFK